MRVIAGKQTRQMDETEFAAWASLRDGIVVDLGTGDGRFVRDLALRQPAVGVIGVDLCAENMRTASRTRPTNALFVAADALELPGELCQAATHLTINFPWGSLLRGVLSGDASLLAGVMAIGRRGASLDLRVNAGALAEAGWALEAGGERIAAVLRSAGIAPAPIRELGARELRNCQTTWAKRLAFCRDPRAVHVAGVIGGGWQATSARARRQPVTRHLPICYS